MRLLSRILVALAVVCACYSAHAQQAVLLLGQPQDSIPTLVPGSLLARNTGATNWAATPQPAAVGSGTTQSPIAGWSSVNFQDVNTTTGKIKFCVDAFTTDAAGIKEVDLQASGGPIAAVTQPVITSEANAPEYCAYLDPSSFSAGGSSYELRATVIPVNGTPKVLQGGNWLTAYGIYNASAIYGFAKNAAASDIYYVAHTGGTSAGGCGAYNTPCDSVASAIATSGGNARVKAGPTIAIKEDGTYPVDVSNLGSVQERWNTITRAAPATHDGVRLVFTNTNKADKVRVKDVTVLGTMSVNVHQQPGQRTLSWADTVTALAVSQESAAQTPTNPTVATVGGIRDDTLTLLGGVTYDQYGNGPQTTSPSYYITDSTMVNHRGGPTQALLVRGVTSNGVANDLWQQSLQVVNSRAINAAAHAISGPYTITSVSVDGKTITLDSLVTSLYKGDCLEDPNGSSGIAIYSCLSYPQSTPPPYISYVDNTGPTTVLTLETALSSNSATKFIQVNSSHVDLWQFGAAAARPDSIILYNDKALTEDGQSGQTVYWQQGATNAAVVGNSFNNLNPFMGAYGSKYTQQYNLNITGPLSNVLFRDNVFGGGQRVISSVSSATDWVERRDVCTNVLLKGSIVPTYDASPTCQ